MSRLRVFSPKVPSRTGTLACLSALLILGPAAAAPAEDLSQLDLSGAWYVLLEYKDDRSEEASLKKFKDFAWSFEQQEDKIKLKNYPYVMFHEELELVRREAMRRHRGWEPSPGLWKKLRQVVRVSPRAATNKTLRGSRSEGFDSLPAAGGSIGTVTFSRDWKVSFAPERVRLVVTDSLSGGLGLEGMEDSIVYEINERVADDELRGTYSEPHKSGSIRMVRSQKVEVLE